MAQERLQDGAVTEAIRGIVGEIPAVGLRLDVEGHVVDERCQRLEQRALRVLVEVESLEAVGAPEDPVLVRHDLVHGGDRGVVVPWRPPLEERDDAVVRDAPRPRRLLSARPWAVELFDPLAFLFELLLQRFDLVGAAQRAQLPIDERDASDGLPPASHNLIRHHASAVNPSGRHRWRPLSCVERYC